MKISIRKNTCDNSIGDVTIDMAGIKQTEVFQLRPMMLDENSNRSIFDDVDA